MGPQLVYHWDARQGRMLLESHGIRLSESEHRALEAELGKEYQSLIERLERGAADLPVHFQAVTAKHLAIFRVRYGQGAQDRCPELILEPFNASATAPGRLLPGWQAASGDAPRAIREEPASSGSAAMPDGGAGSARRARHWTEEFAEEVHRRLPVEQLSQLPSADRTAVGFVLQEFHMLCEERRSELALILLSGYVALSVRMCEALDADRAALYVLAARGLDQLFGQLVGNMASERLAPRPVPSGTLASNFRRITGRLARFLGLDDTEATE